MDKKIIVALDFNDYEKLESFVSKISPEECRLKVGKELFTAFGPQVVHDLQAQGFEIFLDLKFHDIPNTVYGAIRAAADLGVWMVNVHISGGREMLNAARQAILDSSNTKPLLIGVTVLTSLSQAELHEVGVVVALPVQVQNLAKLAYECGLDGVVCSAQEANLIKQITHHDFLTVTPGIRLTKEKIDDQTRIMTPEQAIANGADYLVIGRPITQTINPSAVLQQINLQIK